MKKRMVQGRNRVKHDVNKARENMLMAMTGLTRNELRYVEWSMDLEVGEAVAEFVRIGIETDVDARRAAK